MSSVTRATFKVRKSGIQSVNLDSMLGPGGRRLVQQTMDSLCEGKTLLEMEGKSRQQLAWRRAKGTADSTYELSLPNQKIGTLSNATLNIRMEFRQGLVRVTHEVQGTSLQGTVNPSLEADAVRITNRRVNQVFAVAVSDRIKSKIEQQVQIRQEVQVTVAQNNTIRIYSEI